MGRCEFESSAPFFVPVSKRLRGDRWDVAVKSVSVGGEVILPKNSDKKDEAFATLVDTGAASIFVNDHLFDSFKVIIKEKMGPKAWFSHGGKMVGVDCKSSQDIPTVSFKLRSLDGRSRIFSLGGDDLFITHKDSGWMAAFVKEECFLKLLPLSLHDQWTWTRYFLRMMGIKLDFVTPFDLILGQPFLRK